MSLSWPLFLFPLRLVLGYPDYVKYILDDRSWIQDDYRSACADGDIHAWVNHLRWVHDSDELHETLVPVD